MADLTQARVRISRTGLNGTGVTAGEKTDIFTRLTALEAQPAPATTITAMTDVSDTPATEGQIYQMVGGVLTPVDMPTTTVPFAIPFVVDGGSSAPSVGVKGLIRLGFDATITGWSINANPAGSIVWQLRNAGVAITGSTPPTLASGTSEISSDLTGWSTTVDALDVLTFEVTSADTLTMATLNLFLTREIG